MTKNNMFQMIGIAKRIKQLRAIQTSKEVKVTLWADNWGTTGVGGVDGDELISQKLLKKSVSSRIGKLNKEFSRLAMTFPLSVRAKIRAKVKHIAATENF